MKRSYVLTLFVGLFGWHFAGAQDTLSILRPAMVQHAVLQSSQQDTLITVDEKELPDLRTRLMELNNGYEIPKKFTQALRKFLIKDDLVMSPEAQSLINDFYNRSNTFDPYVTFKDTIIVNRLFMPIVFIGDYLPENLTFYDKSLGKPAYQPKPLMPADSIFTDYRQMESSAKMARRYVECNYPTRFRYSQSMLPKETVKANVVKKKITDDFPLVVTNDISFDEEKAPDKFIPERKYWKSHFESSIQFAQNYVSPNWHKGGNSSLNLNNREYVRYDYNKDRIQFANELEIKNTVYTAPNDTLRNYKVSDDVFRIHSNFGYRAFSKWYYTLDMEFKTQLLSSYAENSDIRQAGFLSPYSVNVGVGMKYDLKKKFKDKHKNLTFNVNVAPLSYTFRQTIDDEINLGKHFKKKAGQDEYPTLENLFGSTINATLNFQINRNVSWYSRFYYNTNYKRIEGEWENRFSFAWSRFFSTNITLNMRYDDGVAKSEDFNSLLQINELLSFGFNYKW